MLARCSTGLALVLGVLVRPAGSRAFAAAAPPEVVFSHGFDDLYHEIFNERDAGPVFEALEHWLDRAF